MEYPNSKDMLFLKIKILRTEVVKCSVQLSYSVVFYSLWPHGLKHTIKLPCPSPISGACSNSCPSNWWCHPIISASVIPFSFYLQSFPKSGAFLINQLFTSGGQNSGASASSISPSSEYSGLISFRMDWFDRLVVQVTLKRLVQLHSSKASILWLLTFFMGQLSHPYMTTGKTIALTILTFVGKVVPLLFNMLSKFVIDFLPRCKCLLISCLQSPSVVILKPKKIKVCHCFPCFPTYFSWCDGGRAPWS